MLLELPAEQLEGHDRGRHRQQCERVPQPAGAMSRPGCFADGLGGGGWILGQRSSGQVPVTSAIYQLHSKLDQLLTHQWQRLLEIQRLQIDALEELSGPRNREQGSDEPVDGA